MTIVFLTLEMPYKLFPTFTERLKAIYLYSALPSLEGHDYAPELPGKSRETWNAHDDHYFSEFLAREGFLKESAWHKRFYLIIEDEDQSESH